MPSRSVDDRRRRVEAALAAYEAGPWGKATKTSHEAAGLCKRASLVLLELLNREGVDDAQLWHLGHPREGSPFAPSDEHYVVVVDDEAIDPTARQFDEGGEQITRRTLEDVTEPWCAAQPVRIGYVDPVIRWDVHGIPLNWRELADVEPPGDAIGWEYPGPWPTDGSSLPAGGTDGG